MTWWLGVKAGAPHIVFREDDESRVTPEHYSEYDYILGPYASQDAADADRRIHINQDGMFIDPFCNGGQGR